jgi:hypothetical protein
MVTMPPKTTCPISRADFLAKAEPLKLDLGNGQTLVAEPREFSTGSFGWYVNQKATITVDGKALSVQVGSNLIVVGSKEAAKASGGGGESAG